MMRNAGGRLLKEGVDSGVDSTFPASCYCSCECGSWGSEAAVDGRPGYTGSSWLEMASGRVEGGQADYAKHGSSHDGLDLGLCGLGFVTKKYPRDTC